MYKQESTQRRVLVRSAVTWQPQRFAACPGGLRRNQPYLLSNHPAGGHRQECPCYSLQLMRKLPTVHCTLTTVRLAGVRTHSQRSGTRFPYTWMSMKLDQIMYEYVNKNENDYAITQAEPELALRAPGLSNHQLQRRARRSSPYLAQHAATDRNVRATVCGS